MSGRPGWLTRSAADDETVGALTERLNTEHRLWLRQLRASYGARTGKAPPSRGTWQPMPIPAPPLCQWPTGDPGAPGFRFCNEPTILGRPYCRACCLKAYRPAPHQMQDAAD